jgi:signal transduction histidine kinase
MWLLRNEEVRRAALVFLASALALIVLGSLISPATGAYTAGVCAVFGTVAFAVTRKRYQSIAALSTQIDRVLHGDDSLPFSESSEGELSILNSELHKMTLRLREQASALQSDKTTLSNAIADISHQLRTPLTAIRLIIPRLQRSELSLEARAEATRELMVLLTRIDWLISSLLKVSEIESGTVRFKRERVDVALAVQKAAEPLLIPMELREQRLRVNLSGDPTGSLAFQGDFSWCVEALGNVLKNCMEHTPAGGTITVTGTENSFYTELVISDSGTGIAPADLPHLFERFYKGAGADNSNIGIGLALSKMIITEQNGTITAANSPASGAQFTIRFFKGEGG